MKGKQTHKLDSTEELRVFPKMESSNTPGLQLLGADEESVDIYDDLDFEFGGNRKSSPCVSSELRESMDLYEDLVAEEQQGKESSYTELKTRFQAAQNQIKELHKRLEQMELRNTSLNSENVCLKKNISALLRTARQEVIRKDAEIQRLYQRPEKGFYHHKSRSMYPRDSTSSVCAPTVGSISKAPMPPPPTPAPLPDTNSFSSAPKPSSSHPPPLPDTNSPKCFSSVSKAVVSTPKPSSSHPPPPLEDANSPKCFSSVIKALAAPPKPNSASCTPTVDFGSKAPSSPLLQNPNSFRCSSSVSSISAPQEANPRRRSHTAASTTNIPAPSSKTKAETDKRITESAKHKSRDKEERHKSQHSSESVERRHKDGLDSNTNPRRSHRADKYSEQKYASCRVRSEGGKTSQPENSESKKGRTHEKRKEKSKDGSLENDRTRSRTHEKPHSGHAHDSRGKTTSSKQLAERCRDSKEKRKEEKQKSVISTKHKRQSKQKSGRHKDKGLPRNEEGREKTTKGEAKADEDSPNRKLCFMETLNLKISPIKKTAESHKNKSNEGNFQPDMDELFVIDELEDRELEDPTERSPQNPKPLKSKGLHLTTERLKDVNKKIEKPEETASHSVQTNSDPSRPPDADASIAESPGSLEGAAVAAFECRTSEGIEDSSKTSPNISAKSLKLPKAGPQTKSHPSALLDSDGTSLPQQSSPDSRRETAVSSSPKQTIPQDATKEICPRAQEIPSIQTQEPSPPSSTSFTPEEDGCEAGVAEDLQAVTSTISLGTLAQKEPSLKEAVHVLTQNASDDGAAEPSSSTGCIAVSKVSSTTEDKIPPEESGDRQVKASSSAPLPHDENSMMRTLNNLMKIPDIISPLQSPVRVTKRSHEPVGSQGHVKSLQKEFSVLPVDANSKKPDVNKENKYPGRPGNPAEKVSDQPSSLSDAELEDGEIISESDDTASSAPPKRKRAKLAQPATNSPSHTFVLRKKREDAGSASKETPAASTQSPRSRFKIVCPSASKASFSSVEEIMETFQLVRSEIRKNYMKLHKTFPKKSFYGMMDKFQMSFQEFVDGADFVQICAKTKELKSKLKNLISSVFNKVLNNGIVKRIFEQQAVDLKQKLWDFVDVQVDYLLKDIQSSLQSFCRSTKHKKSPVNIKESHQRSANKPQRKQKELCSPPVGLDRPASSAVVPYRTGLGSRGKDIRITLPDSPPPKQPQAAVRSSPQKSLPFTPEKSKVCSNGSVLDKTDFQLLTEQQASSLTFNLVRDSQMGEIFKCLLQGSDLLESGGGGDGHGAWSLGTPRKDGERFISIGTPNKFDSPYKLLSPAKFESPSKLVATWSSISPRRALSPRPKDRVPLNPALFDESCLLEIPLENRRVLHTSQKSYSILAEDLAVSLTIPSPLKSDSHLSFLQPPDAGGQLVSTPDSVRSAHISEDAVLDGEDAAGLGFHLTLDTDNSSGGSSCSVASVTSHTSFLFKPNVPMQALVMERSNDHFIVKIRQASTDVTLTADDDFDRTLTVENGVPALEGQATESHAPVEKCPKASESANDLQQAGDRLSPSHSSATDGPSSADSQQQSQASAEHSSESEEILSSEKSQVIPEDTSPEKHIKGRKRKQQQEKQQSKKFREKLEKTPRKKSTLNKDQESASSQLPVSPNSLSAKNVVRKKGEVVMAWTRDEDRVILIHLKSMGASEETFSSLSELLNKPPNQIAHRFYQLMYLYKKQEKMTPEEIGFRTSVHLQPMK